MLIPYIARIVLRIAGHEIELTRFKRQPNEYDIRSWTDELSVGTEWWMEWRLPDKHCITSRPRLSPAGAKSTKPFHLTHEDHARLDNAGLQPSFKNDAT